MGLRNARTLDVTQELQPEPFAFVRALDDARDVCDDERAGVAQLDDAEVGG